MTLPRSTRLLAGLTASVLAAALSGCQHGAGHAAASDGAEGAYVVAHAGQKGTPERGPRFSSGRPARPDFAETDLDVGVEPAGLPGGGPVFSRRVETDVARASQADSPHPGLIRLADPPVLRPPPTAPAPEQRRRIALRQIAVCGEVRGYNDLTLLDPRDLQAGQTVLLYAALENVRGVRGPEGFRSLTFSTLEIRTPDGQVVARQALGSAVDVAREVRRSYFLTHEVDLPEDLPEGNYVLRLIVNDVLARESTRSDIAVRIQGGS